MNEPNVLRQISRQIREDCLTLHGFVDMDPSRKKEDPNNNTIFRPESELSHLGPNSSWIFGPRSSTRRFAACGALNRIRCVAIQIPRSDTAERIQLECLREYKNLEVVFVVVSVLQRVSASGWKEKEWVKFREVDDEFTAMWHFGRRFQPQRGKEVTQEYRERYQGMMARGSERIAPHVVFVEEIRAWDDGNRRL